MVNKVLHQRLWYLFLGRTGPCQSQRWVLAALVHLGMTSSQPETSTRRLDSISTQPIRLDSSFRGPSLTSLTLLMYLTVSVGDVLSSLPVPLPLVRLPFKSSNRRVADDGGLLGKGWHHRGGLLVVIETRQGGSRGGAVLHLIRIQVLVFVSAHPSTSNKDKQQRCF